MGGRQPATRVEIAKHFASNPFLSQFAIPFRDVMAGGQDMGRGFERIAALMAGGDVTGAIQFSIGERGAIRNWSLLLSPKGCDVLEGESERPHLEILTDSSTWSRIASGQLSPLEAMGLGTVRVRGDLRLAGHLAQRLRAQEASAAEPEPEEETDG